MINETLLQNLQQEMKRGSLVLAVLTQMDKPEYGYTLIQTLNACGMVVEQNTLYPLMRRLEKQGLLESIWQIEENRPRRYYQISDIGREVRQLLIEDWKSLNTTLNQLIGGSYA